MATSENPYATGGGEADPYDYDYQPFGSNTKGGVSTDTKKNLLTQGGAPAEIEDESVKIKAMELARREAELEKREAEIRAKEQTTAADPNFKRPNWPRCYPLVYHNIGDISDKLRKGTVILGYIGFFMFTALLILNFVASMISISPFLAAAKPSDGVEGNLVKAKMGFMSGMMLIIGAPAHFFLSYWSLYKAMENVALLRMLIFFVTYALPILFCAFGFAGWYEYGVCGLILVIVSWPTQLGGGGNLAVWITNLVMIVLWTLMALYFCVIYILGIIVFRKESYTLKKAKEVLQSEVVKGVTKTISKGVTSAITGGGDKGDQV